MLLLHITLLHYLLPETLVLALINLKARGTNVESQHYHQSISSVKVKGHYQNVWKTTALEDVDFTMWRLSNPRQHCCPSFCWYFGWVWQIRSNWWEEQACPNDPCNSRSRLFLWSFEWEGHDAVCANLGLQMAVMQRGRVMMPPGVCYSMIITASIMLWFPTTLSYLTPPHLLAHSLKASMLLDYY